MINTNETVISSAVQTTLTLRDSQTRPEHYHQHSLNEIQRRAYRIHERHGGIYGGYTLEDWLEAEHELDEEDNSATTQNDQVH